MVRYQYFLYLLEKVIHYVSWWLEVLFVYFVECCNIFIFCLYFFSLWLNFWFLWYYLWWYYFLFILLFFLLCWFNYRRRLILLCFLDSLFWNTIINFMFKVIFALFLFWSWVNWTLYFLLPIFFCRFLFLFFSQYFHKILTIFAFNTLLTFLFLKSFLQNFNFLLDQKMLLLVFLMKVEIEIGNVNAILKIFLCNLFYLKPVFSLFFFDPWPFLNPIFN